MSYNVRPDVPEPPTGGPDIGYLRVIQLSEIHSLKNVYTEALFGKTVRVDNRSQAPVLVAISAQNAASPYSYVVDPGEIEQTILSDPGDTLASITIYNLTDTPSPLPGYPSALLNTAGYIVLSSVTGTYLGSHAQSGQAPTTITGIPNPLPVSGQVNIGTISGAVTLASGQTVNVGTVTGAVTLAPSQTVNIGTVTGAVTLAAGTTIAISTISGNVTVTQNTTWNIQGVSGGITVGVAGKSTTVLATTLVPASSTDYTLVTNTLPADTHTLYVSLWNSVNSGGQNWTGVTHIYGYGTQSGALLFDRSPPFVLDTPFEVSLPTPNDSTVTIKVSTNSAGSVPVTVYANSIPVQTPSQATLVIAGTSAANSNQSGSGVATFTNLGVGALFNRPNKMYSFSGSIRVSGTLVTAGTWLYGQVMLGLHGGTSGKNVFFLTLACNTPTTTAANQQVAATAQDALAFDFPIDLTQMFPNDTQISMYMAYDNSGGAIPAATCVMTSA